MSSGSSDEEMEDSPRERSDEEEQQHSPPKAASKRPLGDSTDRLNKAKEKLMKSYSKENQKKEDRKTKVIGSTAPIYMQSRTRKPTHRTSSSSSSSTSSNRPAPSFSSRPSAPAKQTGTAKSRLVKQFKRKK